MANLRPHGSQQNYNQTQAPSQPLLKTKNQKLHKMPDEKVTATKSEVQRLLDVGFICEVQYPCWLANVVMVKKKNGK
jgi:hypothetical protein